MFLLGFVNIITVNSGQQIKMPRKRLSGILKAVFPNFWRLWSSSTARSPHCPGGAERPARRKHNGGCPRLGAGGARGRDRPEGAQRARPGHGSGAPGPPGAPGAGGTGPPLPPPGPVRLCALGPHLEQRVRQVHGAPAAQHGHHHRHRDHRGRRRTSAGQPRNPTCPEPFSHRL